MKLLRIIICIFAVFALGGSQKPPLSDRIVSTDEPLFSDVSPYAVPLLGDRSWVMIIQTGRADNPELEPTEPSNMEFWLKPGTQKTYESALFDNVIFLGDVEKGFITQATNRADGKTYYFLFHRIRPVKPFPQPLFKITLMHHKTVTWANYTVKRRKRINPELLDEYLEQSELQDMQIPVPVKGLEELWLHNHWFYVAPTRQHMERYRDQAQAYLDGRDAEAAHEAKLRSWASALRPPLFQARLADNCRLLQNAAAAGQSLGDAITESLGVEPDGIDRLSANTGRSSCTINLLGIASMTLEIGAIDFDDCAKKATNNMEVTCVIRYQTACYSSTGVASDECNEDWGTAEVMVKGSGAKLVRLN